MEAVAFFLTLCLAAFYLTMILGFAWRIIRPLLRLLATPIYLTFYIIEGLSNVHFNVAPKGDKRLLMDFLATLAFLFSVLSIYSIIFLFSKHAKVGSEPSIEELLSVIHLPFGLTLTIIIILIFLFILGNSVIPKDPAMKWHDKIDSLKIFKKLIEDPLS